MDTSKQQLQEPLFLKLYKTFSQNENLIFSPISIYSALSLAALGSEENTLNEFKSGLDFNTKQDLIQNNKQIQTNLKKIPEISFANKVYHNIQQLEQNYNSIMKENFSDDIENMDFINDKSSVQKINKWVSQMTKDNIKQIIQNHDICDDTKMILLNAIYFKDDWKIKFKESKTKKQKFYLNNINQQDGQDNNYKMVDMMYQKSHYNYYENEQFQYILIPYKNNEIRMEIILPNIEINQFEQTLTNESINIARNNASVSKVILYLPKFKIEDQISKNLESNLNKIGIHECFDKDQANFSSISKTEFLYINKVYHKAMIDVNEKGTKAAATTSVSFFMCGSSMAEVPKVFNCNKPFIFMISTKDQNQCLFMGRVVDPKYDENQNPIIKFINDMVNKLF